MMGVRFVDGFSWWSFVGFEWYALAAGGDDAYTMVIRVSFVLLNSQCCPAPGPRFDESGIGYGSAYITQSVTRKPVG